MTPRELEVTAADGTVLACWDFGGEGQPLLMAHGTSLHGRCWAPFAEALPPGVRAVALDMRGHGSSGQSPDGTYDWDSFAQDLLGVVSRLDLSGVVGVGHSAGATSLLVAEATRPGTFAGLWAWEPIMNVPGSDLRTGRALELAARARKRRSKFGSREEAREYFDGRHMFAEFSPGALDSFVEGGLRRAMDGDGLVLACDPEVEARVYEAALDDRCWDVLPGIACPVRVMGGAHSPAVPPEHVEAIAARLPQGDAVVWPGCGHFGPFQRSSDAASDVANWWPSGRGVAHDGHPPGLT